ncbi:YwdI family protein [Gottfriedia acidiceleris]|uniref:YwdI family protein n=1 Tax=Gottfriedia acidiceleris TaxID=371036 RepID=UPI00101D89A4|nr:YwdI family protein [Gottfriedia acidiceleris]
MIYLNISVEKVIQQIENELHKAKVSTQKPGQFRERIASIRSLCELLLEDESSVEVPKSIVTSSIVQSIPSQPIMSGPSVMPILDDSEQSGSLLDF